MLASPDTSHRPDDAASCALTPVRLPPMRAIRLVGRANSHPAPLAAPERPADDGPAESALDLRRKRSRAGVDLLLERARFAAPADAALVRAVFARGVTAADVARAAGIGAAAVRRRLRRIVVRLLSEQFGFVVSQMGAWPEERRRVAATVVIRGLSTRAASIRLGLSLHRVRVEMGHINAAFEAHRALSRGEQRPWRAPEMGGAVIGRIGPVRKKGGTP